MHCLKMKDKNAPPKRLPVGLQMQAGIAKMRASVDPPRAPLKRDLSRMRRPREGRPLTLKLIGCNNS